MGVFMGFGEKLWNGVKYTGNVVFNVANYTVSFAGCALTSFGSVAQLVGQKVMGYDNKSFTEIVFYDDDKAKIVGRVSAMGIPGALAVGGIVWLNVSGLAGTKEEVVAICSCDTPKAVRIAKLRDLLLRLGIAIPAGVAMSVLAADVNLPFLIGASNTTNMPALKEAVRYGTWGLVGLGIAGVLVQTAKDMWRSYAPACLYGKENRAFEDCMQFMDQEIKLKIHGQDIKDFNAGFLAALGLQATATSSEIDMALQAKLKDKPSAKEFFAQLDILRQAYPTAKDHWTTQYLGIAAPSVAASAVGTWSLKGLIDSGYQNASWFLQQTLSWTGLTANIALWSVSLGQFIQNMLNPIRHLKDTWQNSTFKDKALRVTAVILSSCFGTMMALIPLLNMSDKDSKVMPVLEAAFGDIINTLIGMIGVNLTWKFFNGWIKPSPDDTAENYINKLRATFNSASLAQKKEILAGLGEAIESLPTVDLEAGESLVVNSGKGKGKEEAQPLLASTVAKKEATTLGDKQLAALERYGLHRRPTHTDQASSSSEARVQEEKHEEYAHRDITISGLTDGFSLTSSLI